MRSNFLPKLGQCIDTLNGGGVVASIRPLPEGDFGIIVARFEAHELEHVTMSEWNDYEEFKIATEKYEGKILGKHELPKIPVISPLPTHQKISQP